MGNLLEGKQCYLVVLGSFLISLSFGGFYTFETIEPSLIKFMNQSSMSRGNVNVGYATWILGLMSFGAGTAVSAGGILAQKIGSSFTVFIGGWIMSLNVALTYYTITTYLSIVAISYGLFCGIGIGLSYGVAMGAPCKWFPNNRGLIIGIVLSGYAISSAVITQIQFSIIHMGSNLDRLPFSFLVLGLIYAILQFLGSVLIKDKSENDEEITTANSFRDEFNQLPGIFDDHKCLFSEQIEFKTHQLLLEFDFWILWWTMFINSSSVLIFKSLYVKIAQYYNQNSPFVLFSTVGSIFNCLGSIFWGCLIDRKSYTLVIRMIMLPFSVFLFTLPALLSIPNEHVFHYLYGFWISAINFLLSGTYVVLPTMCAKLYGMKHFVSNYGFLFTSDSVSSIIVCPILSFVGLMESNAFIIAGAILLISAGLTFLFRGKSLVLNRL